MTPTRLAEIRAYIQRLDLDQLPPWTVEQAIIRDLWEALQEGESWGARFDALMSNLPPDRRIPAEDDEPPANPYRADAS